MTQTHLCVADGESVYKVTRYLQVTSVTRFISFVPVRQAPYAGEHPEPGPALHANDHVRRPPGYGAGQHVRP